MSNLSVVPVVTIRTFFTVARCDRCGSQEIEYTAKPNDLPVKPPHVDEEMWFKYVAAMQRVVGWVDTSTLPALSDDAGFVVEFNRD